MSLPGELDKLVADFVQLRKSAVSYSTDLASTERPDAVVARANAFLVRLEDTARRADTFAIELRRISSAVRACDLSAAPEVVGACARAAHALEAPEALAPLDDDVLAVIGKQKAALVDRYNASINACLAALAETIEVLHVAGGALSLRFAAPRT